MLLQIAIIAKKVQGLCSVVLGAQSGKAGGWVRGGDRAGAWQWGPATSQHPYGLQGVTPQQRLGFLTWQLGSPRQCLDTHYSWQLGYCCSLWDATQLQNRRLSVTTTRKPVTALCGWPQGGGHSRHFLFLTGGDKGLPRLGEVRPTMTEDSEGGGLAPASRWQTRLGSPPHSFSLRHSEHGWHLSFFPAEAYFDSAFHS